MLRFRERDELKNIGLSDQQTLMVKHQILQQQNVSLHQKQKNI
ncbi:MAG: hypothetical protein ACON5A_00960 [Candidatus Comchoanobacterales bacterium]